jgi:UDP-3-O-[3-hydroxymyristoyl] N-acetylglucosamine deacetylase/3-hydroxyacyl-[acyl-carrier-protein] dehydratase
MYNKIEVKDENTGSIITILPDEDFSITAMCSFESKFINSQFATIDNMSDFSEEIASARTFVFVRDIIPLLKAGLIKGGDLDNALVIVEHPVPQEELDRLAGIFNVKSLERVPEGYLSHTSLRFQNECARHKLLDVLGDFSLVGYPIKGKVIAYKSGHSINTTIARELRTLAQKQFRRRWMEQ